ncbi:PTS sorbitol transporter subunit IIA [Vibrio sp. V27_P1S3P104]|uniref:PTS glucitol/sorbitol transporter subunit IIA n=1 Tax=unclassified Vibrio TaxID=2614977 RepID=UPI00137256DC|nr:MULTISPECIES: PTS glucitol/sorbitol transporter subunit IIA [unclassified Vibrio]NAW68265.1 PTS sorbitol transporter subunit IIA [Vibrio sp. V28_P6S34P95]NAX05840.1 PTS sorbitol transporter subunit IIA [Vibrio sp. V30_P3S12P165]NAX38624.1 PTS sorbitol transporter subunit IIA [Vibrio sp. V27_P1S3P104]NAX41545.1 PTS sorbitol transporter subunit IIA [Vibrio sp. V26_P1S5P106]NNN44880.1 PTS sorbitol transporter subunit IIA [Vibrio sp. 1-1(7)]
MYQFIASIAGVGEHAYDALDDDMMILFGIEAPQEVQDYCFLIRRHSLLAANIDRQSTLMIGERAYIVTSVGELANHNLAMLGHVTLKFDGQPTPELPGTIHLLGPKLSQVRPGETLIFG